MSEENLEPQSGSPLFSDGSQQPAADTAASLTEPASDEFTQDDVVTADFSSEGAGAFSEPDESDQPEASEAVEPGLAESAEAESAEAESTDATGDEIVTEEMVREQIKGLPGKWYVLHTYAGYEKRVKRDLESRIHSMNMEDYIFQVEVPMEEFYETKKGQQKLVSRVRMPGYALVRMDLDDEPWRVVQNTNGVTGFVGNGREPVALTEDEVVQLLTPVVEQQVAAAAVAAGKPVAGQGPEIHAEYEVGETVTLTTEPWVGMPATISQVDAVNQRLTVLMTLVGQETPVDLSFSQVQKMD